MIVRVWEVKKVECYARAETFTEAVAPVAFNGSYALAVANCDPMQNLWGEAHLTLFSPYTYGGKTLEAHVTLIQVTVPYL